ncbi:MAG: undecaprenyldiphospho-muramoylpentapeptide beta-N-acetylglucosaminyltransferase [Archangiaceae bacterium]|nr:undecaprenyldiphospho-muramoylpentapeptide beta-N-acetylglucosaminyltransferase [Archangiaceae bacterium]
MRVLIAGGGTGGHLFPGIALAEEVSTRHPANDVVFVGTRRGLEARVVPANGYKLETITSRGLKGMGLLNLALGLLALPLSFFESAWLLLRHKPDVVVGVGGYSSGPVVMAAWLLGIPTAVQEQNALPGATNKVLGRFVKAVFLAFDEARRFFPEKKVHVIGNPIRRKLLDNYLRSSTPHEKFTVLVFGGSLGAKGLNARVLESLQYLEDLKGELKFLHQTGKADLEHVKAGYAAKQFDAEVVEFIDDMSAAYAKSELVICRAGATTLAELTVCKKAAILVPFPFATDDHQAVNAGALVSAGAAVMFREAELTGEKLAAELRALKGDGERRKKMEKAAGQLGRPEAAREIADVCMELMWKKWGEKGRPRKAKPS